MRRGRVVKILISLSDQFAGSAVSVGVVIATARSSSAADFGAFMLVQTLVVVVLGGFRAVVSMGLISLPVPRVGAHGSELERSALGFAFAIGACSSALLVAVAGLAPSPYRQLALAGSALLPSALGAEALRAGSYRRGDPVRALGVSASVFLLLACTLVVSYALLPAVPVWLPMLAWAVSTAVVLFCGGLVSLLDVFPVSPRILLRAGSGRWKDWALNYLASGLTQAAVPYAIGSMGSLTAVAGVRGAQSVVGLPLQVPQGLQAPVTTHVVTRLSETGKLPHIMGAWASVQVAVVAALGLPLLAIPDSLGRALLGASWAYVESALPFVLLSALCTELLLGCEIVLRVINRMALIVRVRQVVALPLVAFAGIGAYIDGAAGAAAGLAIGNAIAMLAGQFATRRARLQYEGIRMSVGREG